MGVFLGCYDLPTRLFDLAQQFVYSSDLIFYWFSEHGSWFVRGNYGLWAVLRESTLVDRIFHWLLQTNYYQFVDEKSI
jgi:hypothetical protein